MSLLRTSVVTYRIVGRRKQLGKIRFPGLLHLLNNIGFRDRVGKVRKACIAQWWRRLALDLPSTLVARIGALQLRRDLLNAGEAGFQHPLDRFGVAGDAVSFRAAAREFPAATPFERQAAPSRV